MMHWLAANTHLSFSNLSRSIVISMLALLFFPINALSESGTLFYHAHDFSRPIPDAGGLDNIAIWEINLSGAPANALITSVDVEYWINHRWIGDLMVWLTTEHNGQWQDYVLWDREGGSDHDIYEKETGITTWNGLPANRKWRLCAADFAEQDEGRIKEWKLWVNFDSRTLIPQVGPYSQDFTSDKPGMLQGWEYYSTNEGRIQVVNGQLRMDDMVDGSAYSLNEAILHLDLSRRSGVILTLDHFSSLDENNSLPSSFKGHANGDGILISSDGTNWYLLTNLTSDFQQQSFDLDAAIRSAGISYSSDFRIKFQQYGDSSWPKNGRAFDNISITIKGIVPPSEGPLGTWRGTFNSTAYSTSGTISNWIMREDYTTESKWELNVGANTGWRIHPSGTYSFSPANNRLDFLYTGLATIWTEGQITDIPCMLDVNGTVFNDNAWGSYVVKFFPPNLLPFTDTGTWQATAIPSVTYHVFGIEISNGWNYNDPNVPNDTTYDFCLALETDNTISYMEFLTPAGRTFQIPSYTHTQSGNIQTWHYALQATPSEIPSTAGLVGHWKMDDNAATTTVVDSSGKGNHGTARRNTSTLSAAGKIDSALRFNGIDDYINCGSSAILQQKRTLTVSAWINGSSYAKTMNMIVCGDNRNLDFDWGLRVDNGIAKFIIRAGGIYKAVSGTAVSVNRWYHVVGVWDRNGGPNNLKIYVDGRLQGATTVDANLGPLPVYVTIGRLYYPTVNQHFEGLIDNVMIFNRVLSEAEIKALYIRPVSSKECWRYEGRFTRSDALKDYGDGNYTITAHYKDGSRCQTTAWFGIPNTSDAIPQLIQKPVLTFPKHNSTTTSPVTFTWEPCTEANATSIALCLEKQDSAGECVDIETPVVSTGSDPIEISPGIWNAKLFYNHWYDHSNPDGIALQVGKYSESDYRFEVFGGGLVAHWKMNDNAATTTVVDSSGKGNHGTARRNTSALSAAGKINSALKFNGADDYIDCGSGAALQEKRTLTVSAWINGSSYAKAMNMIVCGDNKNLDFDWGLRVDNSVLKFFIRAGGYQAAKGPTVSANQWYHVVGVWDRNGGTNNLRIYVNGSLAGATTVNADIGNLPVYVTIGRLYYPTINQHFEGLIDDVMIFNRALSDSKIDAIYNGGAGTEIF